MKKTKIPGSGMGLMTTGTSLRYLVVDQELLALNRHMSPALERMIRQGILGIQIVDRRALPESFRPEEGLCLADCAEILEWARSRKMAVLGYEQAGSGGQIGEWLPMVVEDFDEVDADFLVRVYQRCHHLPWTVLTTERCFLREMTPGDVDALYELYGPREITRYMEGLNPKPREEEAYIREYIVHMYEFYGYGMWVVIDKATGRLMGRAGLSHLEVEGEVQLELGYVIALEYQRQGYGYEVCQKILRYAREELSFQSIHCLIQAGNLPSVGLAEKLGFVYDRTVLCNGKEMQRYSKILHFS